MRALRFLGIFCIMTIVGLQFANAQYAFKVKENKKNNPDIIFFKILGIVSPEKALEIVSGLERLPEVESVDLVHNYKCKLKCGNGLGLSLNPEDVRRVLLNKGCDFYYPSLEVDDFSLYENLDDYRKIMIPSDYPCESDYELKGEYEVAIESWRRENPEKYSILKELNCL